MSAIADGSDAHEPIHVLFLLYPGMDALDFVGPLQVLTSAQHNLNDPSSKAFTCVFAGLTENTVSAQGASFRAHLDMKDALKRLKEFDILVIPGGLEGTESLLKANSKTDPLLSIISAYAELQKKDPNRERTLLSICTGSLLLAKQGLLQGLAATTHPDYYVKMENICKETAMRDMAERTDVMEERYVVNNARFDLGEDLDENPYIYDRRSRRKSVARKGSNAWKESNQRRESNARRANMKLGGLRVITSGGVTAGVDASLYIVSAIVSHDAAQEIARLMQYEWKKGVVVDSIDV